MVDPVGNTSSPVNTVLGQFRVNLLAFPLSAGQGQAIAIGQSRWLASRSARPSQDSENVIGVLPHSTGSSVNGGAPGRYWSRREQTASC